MHVHIFKKICSRNVFWGIDNFLSMSMLHFPGKKSKKLKNCKISLNFIKSVGTTFILPRVSYIGLKWNIPLNGPNTALWIGHLNMFITVISFALKIAKHFPYVTKESL